MLIIILIYILIVSGINTEYIFRLPQKDKGQTAFTFDEPNRFLSCKAVKKRPKQNIEVDETGLPISQEYLRLIKLAGCKVVTSSKWLKQSVSVMKTVC